MTVLKISAFLATLPKPDENRPKVKKAVLDWIWTLHPFMNEASRADEVALIKA